MAKRDVRADMVTGAVRLLALNGLEGTSFAEVLELVDAPRGSVYHHFPGGKQELISSAIEVAQAHALSAMDPHAGEPASMIVARFVELWRQLLTRSQARAGCSVLAVVVASDDPELLARAAQTFIAWRAQLATLLERGGVPGKRCSALASTIIAACEGAVAVARAERDLRHFEEVGAELVRMTEQETEATHPSGRVEA